VSETGVPVRADGGRLVASYETAKRAIAECVEVVDCRVWADKAAALVAYARMSKDETLWREAQKVQAVAVRRYGELLAEFPRGDQATRYGQEGAHRPVKTRSTAGREAGLSEHQVKQGLRVASIPADEFEAAVESENPPTVTDLAARGTVSRPVAPTPAPTPADPREVAEATTLLRQFAAFCNTTDAAGIARAPGIDPDVLRNYVGAIASWLDRFVTHLRADAA